MESTRYFYPRSPCGERPFTMTITICTVSFLSTLSLRRATVHLTVAAHFGRFLSTLSLRRATVFILYPDSAPQFLSTLSLRRATIKLQILSYPRFYFYPRSPCGERLIDVLNERQKTRYFYPRSPCGERQPGEHHANSQQEFLSTLSLRRATKIRNPIRPGKINFYPRSPCGERPRKSQSS